MSQADPDEIRTTLILIAVQLFVWPKTLDLEIPRELLLLADELIE
jgi:hypothetical protein